MKVKVFDEHPCNIEQLERTINRFCEDKKVINITPIILKDNLNIKPFVFVITYKEN